MSKYTELAKKLKALADRGEEGERETAQRMLDRVMKEHSITYEMLDEEEMGPHTFKVKEGMNWLIDQIAFRVMNVHTIRGGYVSKDVMMQYGTDDNYVIECTPAQFVEIECMYSILQPHWEKEAEYFKIAFMNQHSLLREVKKGEEATLKLTAEEAERIREMSRVVKKQTVHKQIQKENARLKSTYLW